MFFRRIFREKLSYILVKKQFSEIFFRWAVINENNVKFFQNFAKFLEIFDFNTTFNTI